MRESGSPEILAPRETDCGEDWECRAAQISAKAMSASKFWTSDDRAPRGHRERHAKKEWSAKARNHPRVASALPHTDGIASKPLCGEIAVCSRGGRMGASQCWRLETAYLEHERGPLGRRLPHLQGGARTSARPDTARDYRGRHEVRERRTQTTISRCMPGAGLSRPMCGKVLPYMPALQPYRGKPAVRNDREGRGNVGIIEARSAPRLYPTEGLGVQFPGPTRHLTRTQAPQCFAHCPPCLRMQQ